MDLWLKFGRNSVWCAFSRVDCRTDGDDFFSTSYITGRVESECQRRILRLLTCVLLATSSLFTAFSLDPYQLSRKLSLLNFRSCATRMSLASEPSVIV